MSGQPKIHPSKQRKAVSAAVDVLVLLSPYERDGKLSAAGKQAMAAARQQLVNSGGLLVAESVSHHMVSSVHRRIDAQTLRDYLADYENVEPSPAGEERPARRRFER